eukprot:314366_1
MDQTTLTDQIQLNEVKAEPSESPVIVNHEDAPKDEAGATATSQPSTGEANAAEEEKYIPNDKPKTEETQPKDDQDEKQEVKENEEEGEILIRRLYDRDQQVPSVVFKDNPEYELGKVDHDWKYNITMGDLELKTVTLCDGEKKTLWFPLEEYPDEYFGDDQGKKKKKDLPPRKVFVALKVKRVSAVDNIAETFRMRFHIYFDWLPTVADYKSLYQATKDAKSENNPQILMEWEPRWYPHIEFQNMIEEHTREWEVYPEQGCFRIQKFKDFGQKKGSKKKDGSFDCTQAEFIRAKLECEMTFAEELELQSFPFDCQDLSCVMHERITGGVRCTFLPELRKPNFGSIDPRYSVIDEWDLETAIIEFGDTEIGSSHAMIVLRLKVKRRWKVFFYSILLLLACITMLALTAFSLGPEVLGDRLNLLITLILTAIAFSYAVFDQLPNVPYLTYMDQYILGSYGFMVVLMLETSMIRQEFFSREIDTMVFYIATAWLVCYNAGFGIYGYCLRRDEVMKLGFSSDEVEREVNLSRPALMFDYTRRMRTGNNGRLSSFMAYAVPTDAMNEKQKETIRKKQIEMEELYARNAIGHVSGASLEPETLPLLATTPRSTDNITSI